MSVNTKGANGADDSGELSLASISARLAVVERAIGSRPDDHDPSGSGLMGAVVELRDVIGRPPNLSTGETGTGLCGVVAALVDAQRLQGVTVSRRTAAGAAGAVALLQAVIETLRYLL